MKEFPIPFAVLHAVSSIESDPLSVHYFPVGPEKQLEGAMMLGAFGDVLPSTSHYSTTKFGTDSVLVIAARGNCLACDIRSKLPQQDDLLNTLTTRILIAVIAVYRLPSASDPYALPGTNATQYTSECPCYRLVHNLAYDNSGDRQRDENRYAN